ncbi:uncharacterized protein LOC144107173 isoform X1 [Amblyomma americanum]
MLVALIPLAPWEQTGAQACCASSATWPIIVSTRLLNGERACLFSGISSVVSFLKERLAFPLPPATEARQDWKTSDCTFNDRSEKAGGRGDNRTITFSRHTEDYRLPPYGQTGRGSRSIKAGEQLSVQFGRPVTKPYPGSRQITDVAVQCGRRSGPACSSRILRFLSCHGKSSQCLQDLTQRPKPQGRSVEAGGAWPASGIIGLRASGHAWSTRLMLDYHGGTWSAGLGVKIVIPAGLGEETRVSTYSCGESTHRPVPPPKPQRGSRWSHRC